MRVVCEESMKTRAMSSPLSLSHYAIQQNIIDSEMIKKTYCTAFIARNTNTVRVYGKSGKYVELAK